MKHNDRAVATGVLKGYKKHWNPLVNEAFIQIDIGSTRISVPIDRRQIQFLEKEYSIGDNIDVYHDGTWHIRSRTIDMNEPLLSGDNQSTYL